jgi:hypothetical protein
MAKFPNDYEIFCLLDVVGSKTFMQVLNDELVINWKNMNLLRHHGKEWHHGCSWYKNICL